MITAKSLVPLLLTAALTLGAASRSLADPDPEDLPDIGSPAQAMLSTEEEYQIGRMIVRGLRDQDQILEDPEVSEYIRSLGTRLSSQANDGSQRFNFFVVKDNTINAFALPGGFIGVNSGLLLDTKNESELAGVIAHEVAHVTQRHIARSIAEQSKSSLVSTAAMLAAILIGVAGGGDAAMAGVAAAQSLAIQQKISFTRANETEADRVGIGILARSGFDPQGMPAFFETMSRHAGSSEINIPEMLRTHPVTSTRIAETKERAAQLNVKPDPESVSYAITRERLRVLATPAGEDAREYYAAIIGNEPDDQMSLVRFLLYSNEFEVEALIASTSTWQKAATHSETMHKLIDAYQPTENLRLGADYHPAQPATFFSFADEFFKTNPTINASFQVSNAMVDDFKKHLKARQIPFTDKDIADNMDFIKMRIRHEIFYKRLGNAEAQKVLDEGDVQLQKGIELLPEAKKVQQKVNRQSVQR